MRKRKKSKQQIHFDRFMEFHKNNPKVYNRIVARAREFRAVNPERKIGIALIFNLMRWEDMISTDGETFSLRNDFQPYYSRLVMASEPDLEGVFEVRSMFSNGLDVKER